jgi:hypothetical protein
VLVIYRVTSLSAKRDLTNVESYPIIASKIAKVSEIYLYLVFSICTKSFM